MTDSSPAIASSLNLVDAVTPPPSPSENEEKPEPAPEGTELTKAESDLFTLLDLHPRYDLEKPEREQVVIWAKVEVFLDHVQQPFRRKYMFRGWNVETYPLAILCALRAPQELVEKAYAVFPDAGTDAFRRALYGNPEFETVQWLMGELPDAVKCPDDRTGCVALHYACDNPTASLKLVKCIYEAYPAAINAKGCDNQTPLHCAMQSSTIPVIKFMVGKVDSAALLLEDNCNTPLALALLNEDYNVAQYVVKRYPDFFRKSRKSDDWFPLHFVCAEGVEGECLHTISFLLEHHPEAAQQKDANGNLPLALACANGFFCEFDRLEILDLLVRAYPDSISATNNEGEPALDEETKDNLMKDMATQLQEHHQSKRRKTTSNML